MPEEAGYASTANAARKAEAIFFSKREVIDLYTL
jgi:hypothetical protein